MEAFKMGNIAAGPATLERGILGSVYLLNGAPVNIPLMILRGRTEGPVLWLSAGMHGQELVGTGIIWELIRQRLDPATLRGTIAAVPLMNPLSFAGGTYFTPQDGFNLSSAFPGDGEGGLTARMARLIFEEGLQKVDYVIDLHCNPEGSMMFTYAHEPTYDQVAARGYELARAFGLTTVDRPPKPTHIPGRGMLDVCHELGKPGILVEFVPYYSINRAAVAVGVRGMLNVLKTLKMIDGEVEPQKDVLVIPGRLGILHATASKGGIVLPRVAEGVEVKKGQTVADVVDFYYEPVEEIVSPVDGWLVAWPFLNQSVGTGDLVAMYVFRQ
jgi:predicted deacylase